MISSCTFCHCLCFFALYHIGKCVKCGLLLPDFEELIRSFESILWLEKKTPAWLLIFSHSGARNIPLSKGPTTTLHNFHFAASSATDSKASDLGSACMRDRHRKAR
eukprot:scpid23926/ scgid25013/ 